MGASNEQLNGCTIWAEGKKQTEGKTRLDLIPPEAIEGLGLAMTNGAEKYGDHNWRLGLPYSEVYGAAQRHLQKFWNVKKPDIDGESKLPHLYHALCDIAFLLTYEENKERYRAFDDRVKNFPHIDDQPVFLDLTNMTHFEACKHLERGMLVRVLRAAKTRTRGWKNSWSGGFMNSFIKREYVITNIKESGVFFEGVCFGFPAFVLEIISKPEETE